MTDVLLDLILDVGNGPDPEALASLLAEGVKHHPITAQAVVEVVAQGNSHALAVLLDAPPLTGAMRQALSTRGLVAWNENPLRHQSSAAVLRVLLERDADASLPLARGDTVAERLGERLGTIEGNEQRAMEKRKIKLASPAIEILRDCWVVMERAGVDMAEARRVRNMAMEPAGLAMTPHSTPTWRLALR